MNLKLYFVRNDKHPGTRVRGSLEMPGRMDVSHVLRLDQIRSPVSTSKADHPHELKADVVRQLKIIEKSARNYFYFFQRSETKLSDIAKANGLEPGNFAEEYTKLLSRESFSKKLRFALHDLQKEISDFIDWEDADARARALGKEQ